MVGGGMVGVEVRSIVLVTMGVEVWPQEVRSNKKTNPKNMMTDKRCGG
jgi:hypothetical protein